MTILSIVYNLQSVAMAADSRFTKTVVNSDSSISLSTVTDNAEKLFLVRNSSVGISIAGDPHILNGKTWGELAKLVENLNKVDKIANGLHEEFKKHSANLTSFVTGFDNKQLYIYQVTKDSVERVNDKGYALGFTATGSTVGVRKILNTKAPDANMALLDLAGFAEFLVETEIKYERFFDLYAMCGGSIDVLVITKDYAKFIKHKIFNP